MKKGARGCEGDGGKGGRGKQGTDDRGTEKAGMAAVLSRANATSTPRMSIGF